MMMMMSTSAVCAKICPLDGHSSNFVKNDNLAPMIAEKAMAGKGCQNALPIAGIRFLQSNL